MDTIPFASLLSTRAGHQGSLYHPCLRPYRAGAGRDPLVFGRLPSEGRSHRAVTVTQIEERMKIRGEELYTQVLAANPNIQALWFSIRDDIADLRVEITTGIADAASIPWELMHDPILKSPISTRVKAFVRVQSDPTIAFVSSPPMAGEPHSPALHCLPPRGSQDVELRAVANRLLQDLGNDLARYDITALRPPTFERLQRVLADAKTADRPYHIVHFDGHGIYTDLSQTKLADWSTEFSPHKLGVEKAGKHGYLLFEHAGDEQMRPVDGQILGKLLHDNGVPVSGPQCLPVCYAPGHRRSANDCSRNSGGCARGSESHWFAGTGGGGSGDSCGAGDAVTVSMSSPAAQYIGQLYSALAKGRSFGEAATEGRKDLYLNPDRWIGLEARPLQDWFVPVIYEAHAMQLCSVTPISMLSEQPDLDPLQSNPALLRYVPEEGFIGRDETLLALDRAFDSHRVVLLHAYAGQGKSSVSIEFARWYSPHWGIRQAANRPTRLLREPYRPRRSAQSDRSALCANPRCPGHRLERPQRSE